MLIRIFWLCYISIMIIIAGIIIKDIRKLQSYPLQMYEVTLSIEKLCVKKQQQPNDKPRQPTTPLRFPFNIAPQLLFLLFHLPALPFIYIHVLNFPILLLLMVVVAVAVGLGGGIKVR